jgi:polyhydroxyalkanoate synthase
LIPSIINPPNILDLDPDVSLANALKTSGRVLLLDWGKAMDRAQYDLSGHVEDLLLPLMRQVGEPATLIGYCLGGTMALAAAALASAAAVVTLASPWHFEAYPLAARSSLATLWRQSAPVAERIGALPIEVLQAAFWSLDPGRVVAKYARLPELPADSDELRRFVALEDWANGGEPLPLPAARELLVDLFERNLSGKGQWLGRVLPSCPTLHFAAAEDRIVPTETAAEGDRIDCPAGHVGMIIGRSAPMHLHGPLREWLAAHAQQG